MGTCGRICDNNSRVNRWQTVLYNGENWGKWAWITRGLIGDMGVGVGSGTHFPIEHLGQRGFPEVGV